MGISAVPGLDYLLSHMREVFNYNLFKYFLSSFLFLFFWDTYNSNVGAFNVVPEVSETVLKSFHSFFFILLCSSYFHYFISRSLIRFLSVFLLLIPSREFLISFIVLFMIVCLVFSSSRSLLNVLVFSPFCFLDFGSYLLSLL